MGKCCKNNCGTTSVRYRIIDTSPKHTTAPSTNLPNTVVTGIGLTSGTLLRVNTVGGVQMLDLTPAIAEVVAPMIQEAAQNAVVAAGYKSARLVNASGELIANILVTG